MLSCGALRSGLTSAGKTKRLLQLEERLWLSPGRDLSLFFESELTMKMDDPKVWMTIVAVISVPFLIGWMLKARQEAMHAPYIRLVQENLETCNDTLEKPQANQPYLRAKVLVVESGAEFTVSPVQSKLPAGLKPNTPQEVKSIIFINSSPEGCRMSVIDLTVPMLTDFQTFPGGSRKVPAVLKHLLSLPVQ